MMRLKLNLLVSCVIGAAVVASAQSYLSPCDIDLSVDRTRLYVTAHTGKQVLALDLKSQSVSSTISLPAEPTGLVQSADGTQLFVTGAGYDGRVWVIDAKTGEIQREFEVGHTPMEPRLSPDGKTLYVCNRFDNDVSFVDVESGETTARVSVLREPVAADITPNGRFLFVANHNPDGPADVEYVASQISVIDTRSQKVATIPLVNGAEGVRGVKVSPDGKYIFATHFMARFLVPTTQLERGWISTDALSVIRVSDLSLQYTVLLDDVDQGFSNPWAIGFSDDGNTLLITAAGNHEISLIDLPALKQKIDAESGNMKGPAHLNAHNNLSFLTGIRHRIKLNGNGPRALAVVGDVVCVANYFSDSIDAFNFKNPDAISIKTIELNPDMKLTQERQGEIFFNDAELCFQNWLSCATCHPDGRTDAMNWDLLNDGMGNPKNVKSMLFAHKTPRAMWLGVRADAETGVRAGLKHIQFSVRPEEDAQAIDAYLKSLTPTPSPHLVNGELSESALRGQTIFNEVGCVACHPAPYYTNMEMHDVGTTKGQDAGKPVDTPQLVEIWRTAPYLHDGRAATIPELLRTKGHAGILKKTTSLSDQQINDLSEYLLSL